MGGRDNFVTTRPENVEPTGEHVSKLRFRISTSLDGFTAGPNQSLNAPLGVGGERLHEWVVTLETWRRAHGKPGGDVNESTAVMEQEVANVGATIMGRNMFGGGPGPWSRSEPWNGWWGSNPPFHHPVFVLTHHAREPLVTEGGTSFTFVNDGIMSALEQARRAARGRDVALAGGARVAQQYLNAGLVDEMRLHLVPALLGGGERLFDTVDDLHGLALVETIAAPNVTHLRFART
jgi:dihydrofolate reductase